MPVTPERSVENLERDVRTAVRRYDAALRKLDEVAAERDRVIRDAIAADIQRARIVELTGLSAPRIDQIRTGGGAKTRAARRKGTGRPPGRPPRSG